MVKFVEKKYWRQFIKKKSSGELGQLKKQHENPIKEVGEEVGRLRKHVHHKKIAITSWKIKHEMKLTNENI